MRRNDVFRFARLFVCTIVMTLASACSVKSTPPTAAASPGDGGVIRAEKSSCETSGPMQMLPDAEGHFQLKRILPRQDHFCALVVPIDNASLASISSGARFVDYRRSHPTDLISHLVFFNNLTLEITGIAEVVDIYAGSPQDLARSTWLHSGLTLEGVLNFFAGRDYGFAINITKYQPFSQPLSFADARALDAKFQRPYGYLFLDRHPVIESELQRRRPEAILTPEAGNVDGWPEP